MSAISSLISVESLKAQMPSASLVILAAESSMQPMQKDHCYIKGARRIDLEKDVCTAVTPLSGRHPLKSMDELIRVMQRLGIHQGDTVVVYDAGNTMMAAYIWWILHHLGHGQTFVLNGGLRAWQAAGGNVSAVPDAAPQQGDIVPLPSDFQTVTADDIMASISQPQPPLCIIDARGHARFKGEIEPLDPVAGHIPTAINRPFELNLQSDGTFKPKAILAEAFNHLLKHHQDQTIVHQCGSGVSACHNLLAMAYAGFGATALYAGSWSEWCKNPLHPIKLGDD
ncbi:sulfurtransferase [Wohlfahrtiimonas chitiniclastica]|uniref:sulfurtransferase n=1 Tax=Wohlfahrtiimonas chitiniclastica TaxID=400946 RepID=UPI001BCEAF72|nr:sulfurtransferase [Wohlfahrtiimonas chitiniclastica]MBS7823278.1 sulfurtransferase [Wohlfahrtiimonas chitiniclastica]MBS7831160.1 sulfurtransferase [Wohlfahrtiimonas chitiniclastica]MBS7833127.1 sulfurtransferase [Wohlfahrtiimonas chitiniclastica]